MKNVRAWAVVSCVGMLGVLSGVGCVASGPEDEGSTSDNDSTSESDANVVGAGGRQGDDAATTITRYAAVWDKATGPAWQARHGMTSQQYQQQFDTFNAQGYCLADLSGYASGGEARYAAIWEQRDCGAFVARHGLTSEQYQAEFDVQVAKGYRVRLVSAYTVAGEDLYAAVWDNSSTAPWQARHRLTSQQYQAEFDSWTGKGYCITDISGYSVGGEARFAAIWEQKPCAAFVARHGLTSTRYQEEFDTWIAQGYRPKIVNGYRVGGTDYYAATWEKLAGPAFEARHAMTSASFQATFDDLVSAGYRLRTVGGY